MVLLQQISIDTNVPLWSIITCLGTAIFGIIRMYFLQNKMQEDFKNLQDETDKEIERINQKLEDHKEEMNEKIEKISIKVEAIDRNVVEVKTMLNLIYQDKFKIKRSDS